MSSKEFPYKVNIPDIKRTVSLSIWVLNNSGADFTPTLLLGTPSAEDDYTTVTNRLTQSLGTAVDGVWTQLKHTVDISGYTNIDCGLQVELQIPSGSMVAGDTVNLMEFQLEPSIVVTPYMPKLFDKELISCERFCEKSYDYDIVPGAVSNKNQYRGTLPATASGTLDGGCIQFSTRKRSDAYTITFYNPATGANTWSLYRSGALKDTVLPLTALKGEKGFSFYKTGLTGYVANEAIFVVGHYLAEDEL